ncbi:MAG TPA: carboxypeptidase-like regulatory domain-containing protein, partial [Phycisphaerales bacterium]|nr:carboxypeptidase-like regulatory domain-containing protein [Phycisphaerales bacterium]
MTNTSTNTSQRVLTGPDGAFSVSNLGPGVYRVEVETQGYKRTTQQNVELTTTGPTALTIRLEAGSANETVEIRGRAPSVQADGGQIEMRIDARNVVELPIIDRNYQELIGLQSGVTPPQPAVDL